MSEEKQYDVIIYIGRFQPPHLGHIDTIKRALDLSQRTIVLVGSSNMPRTPKNPFTFSERDYMLQSSFPDEKRLHIEPLPDNIYNTDEWLSSIQSIVDTYLMDYYPANKKFARIGIIGYKKDNSSFYLDIIKNWGWKFIDTGLYDNDILNATNIREHLFEDRSLKYLEGVLSKEIHHQVSVFRDTDIFEELQNEYHFLKNYDPSEFPRNEVTADAVVLQSGHILMIHRGEIPGKGLLALPGGFISPNETIQEGMLRELKEETNVRVPKEVLRGSIKEVKVFDDPGRSDRGRIITHAHYIHLKDGEELPRIAGGDDASHAEWIPISEVLNQPEKIYSDHWSIIKSFI